MKVSPVPLPDVRPSELVERIQAITAQRLREQCAQQLGLPLDTDPIDLIRAMQQERVA
jgi:hypothetical protein